MARIFFCGDVINQFSDEQFIDDGLCRVISNADCAVCNFEGVVDDGWFEDVGMLQRPSTVKSIKEAGFDVCLLANNHITDYGRDGLRRTVCLLEESQLYCLGAGFGEEEVYRPLVLQFGGERIGFINLCEAQVGHFESGKSDYGYAWIGWCGVEDLIVRTRARVDFLFVCVHAGLEHYELPLLDFRLLYRRFCDWGADCVVGAHPHIAQGYECYGGKYIFYSLGNFFFPRYEGADGTTDYENNSFSIVFDTRSNGFEVVYHRMDNLKVYLVKGEESVVDLERLNGLLSDDVYPGAVKEQNRRAYDDLVSKLFRYALNGQAATDSFARKVKNTIKYFLRLRDYDNKFKTNYRKDKLLQRLVENETYRFLTIDVLSNYKYE